MVWRKQTVIGKSKFKGIPMKAESYIYFLIWFEALLERLRLWGE